MPQAVNLCPSAGSSLMFLSISHVWDDDFGDWISLTAMSEEGLDTSFSLERGVKVRRQI